MLRDLSSSEIAGWIAYLAEEEARDYTRQMNALAAIATQLFRKEES